MNKRMFVLPAVIGGLILSSGISMAKPSSSSSHSGFISKLDANKDGAVSRKEFNANLTEKFANVDKGGDGTINLAEFTQHGKERKAAYEKEKLERRTVGKTKYFKMLDSNGDGSVSESEYISAATKKATKKAQEHFVKLDGDDQDGKISQEEFVQKRGHKNYHDKSSSKSKKRSGHHSSEKMFAKMDTNTDGEISLEENKLARSKWFNRLDKNEDGLVTADELKQAHKDRQKD